MDERLYYTEAEAASLLGLTRWALRRQRYLGRVAFTRLAGKVRYCRAQLLEYARAFEVGASCAADQDAPTSEAEVSDE